LFRTYILYKKGKIEMVTIPFNNLTRKTLFVVTKSPSKGLFTSHYFNIFFLR